MGAESDPMVTMGSAVVQPMRMAPGSWVSSVSSATMAPGMAPYQGAPPTVSDAKPTPLPKDMAMTASAAPYATAQAAFTLPARRRLWKESQPVRTACASAPLKR